MVVDVPFNYLVHVRLKGSSHVYTRTMRDVAHVYVAELDEVVAAKWTTRSGVTVELFADGDGLYRLDDGKKNVFVASVDEYPSWRPDDGRVLTSRFDVVVVDSLPQAAGALEIDHPEMKMKDACAPLTPEEMDGAKILAEDRPAREAWLLTLAAGLRSVGGRYVRKCEAPVWEAREASVDGAKVVVAGIRFPEEVHSWLMTAPLSKLEDMAAIAAARGCDLLVGDRLDSVDSGPAVADESTLFMKAIRQWSGHRNWRVTSMRRDGMSDATATAIRGAVEAGDVAALYDAVGGIEGLGGNVARLHANVGRSLGVGEEIAFDAFDGP
jgi:hypothetical protein